ncbi:MAG: carboxypeptidase regulatory-like domain-containing protein [Chlorobium sp.]|nr:carboxypeptidase regulatory-like domain-containing protein [Chlorobium sp.]MCW8818868.1 carboxypeptidase regulatory-like domain-containing protein [Ignavibacteriaceae bacterium]
MKRKVFNAVFMVLVFSMAVLLQKEAFAAGKITGMVEAQRARFKKDAVVYLKGVPGTFAPPAKHYTMDQKDLIFTPHVLPVVVGSSVDFKNSDNVNHNVFTPTKCKPFNLGTYGKGVVKTETFDKSCVVDLLCNVHSEMSAFVVVLDNPYFAKTGADGSFTIENVPPGTYQIAVWSEKLKAAPQTVTVKEGGAAQVTFNLAR